MPNKRDPMKRIVSFWLPMELKKRLQEIANEQGTSLTDLILGQLEEIATKEKNDEQEHDD